MRLVAQMIKQTACALFVLLVCGVLWAGMLIFAGLCIAAILQTVGGLLA